MVYTKHEINNIRLYDKYREVKHDVWNIRKKLYIYIQGVTGFFPVKLCKLILRVKVTKYINTVIAKVRNNVTNCSYDRRYFLLLRFKVSVHINLLISERITKYFPKFRQPQLVNTVYINMLHKYRQFVPYFVFLL